MGKKPIMEVNNAEIEKNSVTGESTLNSWLEQGMKLPFEDLAVHVCTIPNGVKPLNALRGLGIIFSGGFTKDYNCIGFPQTVGLGKDRQKLDIVVERVRFHEKNGESIRKRGMTLSEVLESNFNNNR